MIFRVLDIETVPDHRYWTPGAPHFQLSVGEMPTSSPTGLYPPMVRLSEAFPPPQACRVVALSSLDMSFDARRDPKYKLEVTRTDCRWHPWSYEYADLKEAELLRQWNDLMSFDHEGEGGVHLVTWNGRSFDLPVLVMRSMLHGQQCGWYYKSRDVRYRYSQEGHLDLMDFFGEYGACRNMKLSDVSRICGLPGKTDMKGDQVADLYQEVRECYDKSESLASKVASYCLQDVVQTALVFVRSRLLMGKIGVDAYRAVVADFRSCPEVRRVLGESCDWCRVLLSGLGGGSGDV